MREISLDNWIKEGHGFSADSYRNKDDETLLLKLFYGQSGHAIANQEYLCAKAVIKMGIPTPDIYEMVKVGEQTGIIYERVLNKKSFGKACSDEPEKAAEYARMFARYSKLLHTTKCDKQAFPFRNIAINKMIEATDVSEDIKAFMRRLMDELEDADTCIHGDLQTGNMVIGWCNKYEGREQCADDPNKAYFIDLSAFSYGNPLLDVAAIYLSTQLYKDEPTNIDLIHMDAATSQVFWENYVPEYIGSDDPDEIKAFEDRVAPYAIFFIIGIIYYADGNQEPIDIAMKYIQKLFDLYA